MTTKIHKKLNELESTTICGNDISSSVLYVSALAIAFAGQYAWVTLLIVAVICNIVMEPGGDYPSKLVVFLDYFTPFMVFIIFMFNRTLALKLLLRFTHYIFDPLCKGVINLDRKIKVMLYVKKNEHTN